MFNKARAYSLATVLCVAVLCGCDRTITVKYSHLANCHEFQSNPNSTTGAGDGLFMLYRINSIENHPESEAAFIFRLANLFAKTPGNCPDCSTSINAHILLEKAADKTTVEIGQTVSSVGKIFIRVPIAGDLQSQLFTSEPLGYSAPSDVKITFVKETPFQPAFLSPCTTSNVYAYP